MSVARLAIRAVFVGWLGYIVQFASAFLITPILIKNLGVESYGVWQLIMDVVGYCALLDLGVGSSTVKHLSEFESKQNWQAYVNCVAIARRANRVQAIIVTTIVVFLAAGFPYFLKLNDVPAATVRLAALFNGLRVAITMAGMTSRCIIRSKNRFDLSNAIDLSFSLLSSLGMLALALAGGGLIALGLLNFALGVGVQVVALVICRREGPCPTGVVPLPDPEIRRRMFNYGSFTVLSAMASRVSNFSGSIVVGFLLNPTQLGFYAPAASLTSRVQTVGNGMVGFLLPSMSRAQAKSDLPTMRRMSILSIRILLCFAMFISIASVFFGREFIRIWLDNPDFTEKTYPVLVFLSLALLVRIPSAAVTSSLAGLGQVQLLANRAMLEAGTTVVLQLALAVPFGLPGVAAGLLISQFLVVAALQPQYLAKAIEMPVRSFLSQSLARPAVAGLLTVVAAATLTRFWPIGVLADPLTTWIGMLGIRDSIANRVAQLFELGIQVAVVGAAMFPPVFFLCLDRDARSAFRPKWRKTATPPPASLDSTERGTN